MHYYFDAPAKEWEETIPIGNGKLGGMIWGEIEKERIGLNDDTFWSGYPREKAHPFDAAFLQEVRAKIVSGATKAAEHMLEQKGLGEFTESYLNLGELEIIFAHQMAVENTYRRALDIDKSTVAVSYQGLGGAHQREYFASYPDQAIFGKITQETPMDLALTFKSDWQNQMYRDQNGFIIHSQAPEHVDPNYVQSDHPIIQGTRGGNFVYRFTIETDGTMDYDSRTIVVQNANYLCFSFQKEQEEKHFDYQRSLEDHIQDYQNLYHRMAIYLGEDVDLPIDQRLKNVTEDTAPSLIALLFQFGRYLLISSSRPGSLPANLQGIWSWQQRAPWSSNWTSNINLEMNYWGADSCNLSECFLPYQKLIEQVIQKGKKTARQFYGVTGACCHHNIDIWVNTDPVGCRYQSTEGEKGAVTWSVWPMAAAWLTADLYRHYEYLDDPHYLEEIVYPNLRESVLFLSQFLQKRQGVYHTIPSTSPENSYYDPNGEICAVDFSTTMDISLVRENCLFFVETCERLHLNDPLRPIVEEILLHLPEIKIGSQGQILEWQQEYPEVEPGHRHFSHLYGVYPGQLFSAKGENGAKESLKLRMAHGSGHTGWSNAWLINLYAVLEEADLAYQQVINALKNASYPNLWSKHPPFQIDGNFGCMAGIANLFVQERNGDMKILPALPDALASGYVKGLKLKKNQCIDIYWENHEVTFAKLYPCQN